MSNLGLSRPQCLLSAGTSPPICLSFASLLLHRLLSRASTLRHLSLRSRSTRSSSTPPLCSRQLVVVSHLFASPPHLDVLPPHNWMCCRHPKCAGVVAINAQASSPMWRLQLSPSPHVVKLVSLPSLLLLSSMSVAIVVPVISRCAIAIIVNFSARRAVIIIVDVIICLAITLVAVVINCCAITIVVNFIARCTVAIVVLVVARCTITIVVNVVVSAITIVIDVKGMGLLWRWQRCPTT